MRWTRGLYVFDLLQRRGEDVEQGQRSRSVRPQGVADGNGVKWCDLREDKVGRAGDVRTRRSQDFEISVTNEM